MNMDMKKLYDNRFKKKEIDRKHAIWKEICAYFAHFLRGGET